MKQKGSVLLLVIITILLTSVVATGAFLYIKNSKLVLPEKNILQTKSFSKTVTPSPTPVPLLFKIVGNSMTPQYKPGQTWEFTYYKNDSPSRGDVALIINSINPDTRFAKRLIGMPKEKIKIASGSVYINDQLLNEPYLEPGIKTTSTTVGNFQKPLLKEGEEYLIPEDSYFILGDNRPGSSDSRDFGAVNQNLVVGKLTKCYQNCEASR